MSITQDYDGGLTTGIGSYGKTEEEENNPNGPTQQAIEQIKAELENISGITVYEYSNEQEIKLSDSEEEIILIRYVAEEDTKAEFKAEILVNVAAAADTVSATDSNGSVITFQTDGKAVITLTYRINQEEQVTHIPVETLGSGYHIITLFYQINGIKGDTVNSFEVLAQVENGTADIAIGGIVATVSGDGFANTEIPWDGHIEVEDTISTISVSPKITMIAPEDYVTTNVKDPAEAHMSDTIGTIEVSPVITLITPVDAIAIRNIVQSYTVSVDREETYEYDRTHVDTSDNAFALRISYDYISHEEEIDSGHLSVVEIPASDFSRVESMEVK
jgi:hypothetical protein